MMRLARCEVVTEDEVHPYIKRGLVTVFGDSPNATVKLAVPGDRKFVSLDMLHHCTITKEGGTFRITGSSDHLRHTVASRSTRLTLLVSPGPECENCP